MNYRAAVMPCLEPQDTEARRRDFSRPAAQKKVMPRTRWSEITDVYQSEPWQDLNELWHPCHISVGAH
jgi:hypothetical protein